MPSPLPDDEYATPSSSPSDCNLNFIINILYLNGFNLYCLAFFHEAVEADENAEEMKRVYMHTLYYY